MSAAEPSSWLLPHLALVVLLKLVVLFGLWFAFMRPVAVRIDASQVAAQLAGPPCTSQVGASRGPAAAASRVPQGVCK